MLIKKKKKKENTKNYKILFYTFLLISYTIGLVYLTKNKYDQIKLLVPENI